MKTEQINAISGGYRRPFQRDGQGFGRGAKRGGGGADPKCFSCDQSGLLRNISLSVQHGMPRIILVEKPDTTNGRAGTAEQQEGDAWY